MFISPVNCERIGPALATTETLSKLLTVFGLEEIVGELAKVMGIPPVLVVCTIVDGELSPIDSALATTGTLDIVLAVLGPAETVGELTKPIGLPPVLLACEMVDREPNPVEALPKLTTCCGVDKGLRVD